VYFLMKQCLQQGSKVSLFYGARSKEEILSLPKLDSVGLNMYVATEDGSVGYHGKVSDLFASFLQTLGHPNAQGARAFVCGPTPMMVAIAELLERFGLPGQFSLETQMACGYGACQGCVVETAKMNEQNMPTYQRVCVEGPVFFLNEIPWDRLRVSKNILFRG
jgi:dihydroorotate dehydrogenase electron transfer subunit